MAERDLLDYYLGPTGIPDRLRALGELDPVQGIMRGMSASGRAADSDLTPEQRRAAAGEAALETGIALLPVGMGRLMRGATRSLPQGASTTAADTSKAVVETLTGATPDLESPGRRRFMAGMGAAAVAPLLPAEELLTKTAARGAGKSALGPLLAKKAQRVADHSALSDSLNPLDRTIAAAGRYGRPEDLPYESPLMTPKLSQARQAAEEAMQQRRGIVADLRAASSDLNSIDAEITDALLDVDDLQSVLKGLEDPAREKLASDTIDSLVGRISQRRDTESSYELTSYVLDSLAEKNTAALVDLGLTKPEAALAENLWPIMEEARNRARQRLMGWPSDTQNFKDGGLIQTPPGTRRGSVLPATWPEGMSGGEALMSGQAELALPGMIADPVNSVAEALMTLDRLRRGEEQPREKVQAAGTTLAAVPMGPATMARRSPNTLFANPPSGGRKVQGRFAEGSTLSEQATRNIRAPEANTLTGATKRQMEDLASRKAAPQAGEGKRAELSEVPVDLRLVRAPLGGQKIRGSSGAPQAIYDPVTGEARAAPQRRPGDVTRMAADSVAGDPGHEWLEVPKATMDRLNLSPQNFTDERSRLAPDGRTVYLASGPDTARFLQAWRQQAEFFGLPASPNLLKPRALPNSSIFTYPKAGQKGKSFEDMKQEARGATVKSQGPTPKSKFFD